MFIFRSVALCNEWFSFTRGIGQIDHKFPIASRDDVSAFSHMFNTSSKNQLTDSHLWISVAFRPQKSHFTRAQRLTCCFSALFMSMIASAMFYGTEAAVEQPQLVSLGPFRISLYELWVSVLSIVIVVPANVLIVTIFRKIRPPTDHVEGLSVTPKNSIMTLPPTSVLKQMRRDRQRKKMKEISIISRKSTFIDVECDNELKEMFGSQVLEDLSEEDMEEIEYILENEYEAHMELLESEKLFEGFDEEILDEINDMLGKESSEISKKQDRTILDISNKNEVSFMTDKPITTIIGKSTHNKSNIDENDINIFEELVDDISEDLNVSLADEMYQIVTVELENQLRTSPVTDRAITTKIVQSSMGNDHISKEDMKMFDKLDDDTIEEMYHMLGNELPNQSRDEQQFLSKQGSSIEGDMLQQYLDTQQKHSKQNNFGHNESKGNDRNSKDGTYCYSRQHADVDVSSADTLVSISRVSPTKADVPNNEHKKKPAKGGLPRGCLVVGWILAVLAIISPAFFLILYSMDWGKEKSNAWLVSFVMSLLESLFVTDPIKVLCLYIFKVNFYCISIMFTL